MESAPLHLEMWANYTLSGLQACRGRPTIIFPSTMLTSRATVEMAVMVLYEQLVAAGEGGSWVGLAAGLGCHSKCSPL